jgi:hypothetical protein
MAPDRNRRRALCPASPLSARQEFSMLDILMLALGAGFFILSVGYAYACERM